MVMTPPLHGGGPEFESQRAHLTFNLISVLWMFFSVHYEKKRILFIIRIKYSKIRARGLAGYDTAFTRRRS